MVAPTARSAEQPELIDSLAGRVRELAGSYRAPQFAEVPSADAALFLCAIDHRSGYTGAHTVEGEGPYEGSDLIWHLGCAAERRRPGALSSAELAGVDGERVEEIFEVGGETVAGAERRAELWRDLAAELNGSYAGSADRLIETAQERLGGEGGLIALLAKFEAYSDPLAKKSFLFAKIAARRGWLAVADPQEWQVCADNVLMRLALRSGLVQPAPVDELRARTRDALKRLADAAGVEPPLLDDLLWERGREEPDLLGSAGGDLLEPPRPEGTIYY